jgi:hypothetical protein
VIGSAALGVVAASPVLYSSAASSAFVQAAVDARCEADLGANVSVVARAERAGSSARLLERAAEASGGLGAAQTILATADLMAETGELAVPMGLMSRPGFEDHVDVIDGPDGDGVWVPDDLAARLGLAPGDTFAVSRRRATDTDPRSELRVAAVYRSIQMGPLDRYWCAARPALEARGAFDEVVPPPAVLATEATLFDTVRPLNPSAWFRATVLPPDSPVRTHRRLDQLSTQTATFEQELEDLAARTQFDVASTSAAPGMAERTAQVRSSLTNAIRPVAVVGVLVVVTALVALGPAWVRRRRHEVQLLRILGASRPAIGAKAVLELLPLVVLGTGVGWVLARVAVATVGPSRDLDPGVIAASGALAAAVAAVALVGAGVAAGASARRADDVAAVRTAPTRALITLALVIGVSAVGVAALRAWRALDEATRVNVRERQVGPSAVTVPTAVFLLAGMVTAAAWVLLTRRRRRRPGGRAAERPVPLLAVRRLQAEPVIGAGLVAVGVAAVATVLFGLVLSASVRDGADAKMRAVVGAETAVKLVSPPAHDLAGTTILRTGHGTPVDGSARIVLLGLDAATFADGVSWYTAGGLGPVEGILDEVAPPSPGAPVTPGAPVPAVLVAREGTSPPADEGELVVVDSRGRTTLPYRVVRHVESFPGVGPGTVALVMDQSALEPFDTSGYTAWSQEEDSAALIRDLAAAGARPTFAETAAGALDSSPLLYLGWALEFLALLAQVVGLVVLAGLAVHVSVRQRSDALSGSFLSRMGLGRARHVLSLVLELALLALLPLAVGVAAGGAMARAMVERYDTIPTAAPGLTVTGVGVAAAVIAAVLAVAVAVVALVADAAGRRLDVAEALRAPE